MYPRFISFWAFLQSLWKKIYQSFLLSFFFYDDNQSWPKEHNLWLFKWPVMSLKCGLPTCIKWSYICEEGHKIKWCYTSICIYVLLCRLGEYCQNIYDKLYHCLCLYFLTVIFPTGTLTVALLNVQNLYFRSNKEEKYLHVPKMVMWWMRESN